MTVICRVTTLVTQIIEMGKKSKRLHNNFDLLTDLQKVERGNRLIMEMNIIYRGMNPFVHETIDQPPIIPSIGSKLVITRIKLPFRRLTVGRLWLLLIMR